MDSEIMNSSQSQGDFDHSFKILLVGDTGVGKSSLLLRFASDTFDAQPTIGVDFKSKLMTLRDKRLKLTIWDTAGQEKFRTLTSTYYRAAEGIILVYDVTRRETFANLSTWLEEVQLYSTKPDCIKMVVGNKVDMENENIIQKKEGMEFANEHGCLFIECSAKTNHNVEQCFEELLLKILDTPSLWEESTTVEKIDLLDPEQPNPRGNDPCC